MNWNILNSHRLYIPIISAYFMTYFCPMTKEAGKNINARPPAYVFGIVWPILYLLLGYSWVMLHEKKHSNTDMIYALNLILGALWIFTYSCNKNKKIALFILLAMVLASLYLIFHSFELNPNITYLVAPYTVWLLFALMLNFKEVNDQ